MPKLRFSPQLIAHTDQPNNMDNCFKTLLGLEIGEQ
jgi:hypothetical protein